MRLEIWEVPLGRRMLQVMTSLAGILYRQGGFNPPTKRSETPLDDYSGDPLFPEPALVFGAPSFFYL